MIGEGAQAKVMLAKHFLTKNIHAIKVINKQHIRETILSYYSEPQLALKLAMEPVTCSQLVQVYNVFEDE